MAEIALKNREVFPADDVLKQALGPSFDSFKSLGGALSLLGVTPEWNYYRDGNAWLCKMPFKKKNLGWIAVYDGYFMVTCYFTEKHLESIANLDISETLKEDFCRAKPAGKLIPMSVTVCGDRLPEDVPAMLRFKIGLK